MRNKLEAASPRTASFVWWYQGLIGFSLLSGLLIQTPFVARADEPNGATTLKANPVLGKRVSDFLEAGFQRGAKVVTESAQRFEKLHADGPQDGRLDFAHGLVLLRQLRNKEAQAQFLAATQRIDGDYWPAWQALIWTCGLTKDLPSAFTGLDGMTSRLIAANDAKQLRQQAAWLGQVMGALETVDTTEKGVLAWHEQNESLRKRLTDEQVLAAYDKSLEEIREKVAVLEDGARTAKEALSEKKELDRNEKQEQNDKNLEAATEKRDKLKKTAEEWKKSLDEQLGNIDKQLGRLERDHSMLEKKGQGIVQSQLELDREMTRLQNQLDFTPPNNNPAQPRPTRQQIERQMDAVYNQKLRLQAEYDQTLASAQKISQQGNGLIQQRQRVINDYQKATGQLVKQDATLDKWQDRLKKDNTKLKAAANAKETDQAAKSAAKRSFRSLIDFDIFGERDALLVSYGVTPAAPPEALKKPK